MKIIELCIEKFYENIGIDSYNPIFSWKLENNNGKTKQKSYRLTVAKSVSDLKNYNNLYYDTGVVNSENTNKVRYTGKKLSPLSNYYWQIEILDDFDVWIKSSIEQFVTSKLNESWQSEWIGNGESKPIYLRKNFLLNKKIKHAYVAVTGLGHFIFYVNGQKISNHILDPGWTNYNKNIQYTTFDISKNLVIGNNSIGIELGNGFYSGESGGRYFGFESPDLHKNYGYLRFSDVLCTIAEIHIEYTDGKREILCTNNDWKVKYSAVKLANIHGSEIFDARDFPHNWTENSFNDSSWDYAKNVKQPKGNLIGQNQPPITTIEVMYPIKSYIIDEQNIVFDFGKNISGMVELTLCGNSGDKVDIYFSEKLKENNDIDPYAEYNGTKTHVNSYCTYILCGGKEEKWKQKFSYFGGRYIKVSGISTELKDNLPQILNISINYISSASNKIGNFSTDNDKINDVYSLVLNSIDSNLKSVHTDCPTLEKSAWLEASHLLAPSIMFYKDVRALWYKIFNDIRDCQYKEGDFDRFGEILQKYKKEGFIPSRAPYYSVVVADTPVGDFWDSLVWGSTIILGVDWYYQYYNDISLVEEFYQTGFDYVNYLLTKIDNDGFSSNGLGDWGNPNDLLLAHANVNTAFLYKNIKTLEKFAILLNKADDAIVHEKRANEILENYNTKLLIYNELDKTYCYTAHPISNEHREYLESCGVNINDSVSPITVACQVLPLCFDMVPKNRLEDVTNSLLKSLKKDGFMVGEITLPFLLRQLSKMGMDDLIVDFMLSDTHPSYYRFIEKGETSLPEFWSDNSRSRNHDMMGHIIEWMYTGIAGINSISEGFKEILFKPFIPQNTSKIECSYNSVSGQIKIIIKKQLEVININLEIPVYSTGVLDISKLIDDNFTYSIIVDGEKHVLNKRKIYLDHGLHNIILNKLESAMS